MRGKGGRRGHCLVRLGSNIVRGFNVSVLKISPMFSYGVQIKNHQCVKSLMVEILT